MDADSFMPRCRDSTIIFSEDMRNPNSTNIIRSPNSVDSQDVNNNNNSKRQNSVSSINGRGKRFSFDSVFSAFRGDLNNNNSNNNNSDEEEEEVEEEDNENLSLIHRQISDKIRKTTRDKMIMQLSSIVPSMTNGTYFRTSRSYDVILTKTLYPNRKSETSKCTMTQLLQNVNAEAKKYSDNSNE